MTEAYKPFDTTPRELFELGPADWLRYVHVDVPESALVEVVNANVSTVVAGADTALRVTDDPPWIFHIEIQASRDPWLPKRMMRYNALIAYRYEMPVRSTVVLLLRAADGPDMTGVYERGLPGEAAHLIFRYNVVRAWEQRAEDVLAGGLATLPLVAISDVSKIGLTGALAAMSDRLMAEASPSQRETLLASTRLMMGLRFQEAEINETLGRIEMTILGIRGIEESTTYQEIFRKGVAKGEAEGEAKGKAEGEVEATRKILLRQGSRKFGNPDQRILDEISTLADLDRLLDLLDRVQEVGDWDALLLPEVSQRNAEQRDDSAGSP